jgi:signal transduction histidine kinase
MALHESEAGYRELFEGNPLPMWVCHRETRRFLAVNEAALRLYGYRRKEFLELSLSQLVQDGEAVEAAPEDDRTTSGRHLKKDRSQLQVELAWHPLAFHGTPALLAVVRAEGQPERDKALANQVAQYGSQLQAAQRELETFSYSISHDLQAPLRHINGFSQALLDDYAQVLDHQAQEYLTRISQAANKMSTLIEAVLKLSRVARAELECQSVNLSVTAQVIALGLKHDEPQRVVEFSIEDGVSAQADPKLARKLMEILIGNAWKFSSRTESAAIAFGREQLDGETVYFVRDNGVGFDMTYAEKLFSIFHRLHRADEFEGVGVGLAIAHRIVGRHGGRIWAQSAPGQGATFYFTL